MTRRTSIADATNVLLASALAADSRCGVITSATNARWLPLALGVPAGFFAADILSGLVHWFCDTYFQPEDEAYRSAAHRALSRASSGSDGARPAGVLERTGNNCFAALPLLAFGRRAVGPGSFR